MYEIGLDLRESSWIQSAGDSETIELLHRGYSGGDGFRRADCLSPNIARRKIPILLEPCLRENECHISIHAAVLQHLFIIVMNQTQQWSGIVQRHTKKVSLENITCLRARNSTGVTAVTAVKGDLNELKVGLHVFEVYSLFQMSQCSTTSTWHAVWIYTI